MLRVVVDSEGKDKVRIRVRAEGRQGGVGGERGREFMEWFLRNDSITGSPA